MCAIIDSGPERSPCGVASWVSEDTGGFLIGVGRERKETVVKEGVENRVADMGEWRTVA